MATVFRRVTAAPWSGRAAELVSARAAPLVSGRAAPLAPLASGRAASHSVDPRFHFYGAAARFVPVRRHSTGSSSSKPNASYWTAPITWVKEMGKKYSEMSTDFQEADKVVRSVVQAGKYLYFVTSTVIGGCLLYIDYKIAGVVDSKVGEERKNREEFQRCAVRDFQEHVGKTQTGLNKLHEKVLDNREAGMGHRHQILDAAKLLELNGYLVVSSQEFNTLVQKVTALEKKGSCSTDQAPVYEVMSSDLSVTSMPISLENKGPISCGQADAVKDEVVTLLSKDGKTVGLSSKGSSSSPQDEVVALSSKDGKTVPSGGQSSEGSSSAPS